MKRLIVVCALAGALGLWGADGSARARLRALADDLATFEQAVAEGLKSPDGVVRRWALCQLWKKDAARAVEIGRKMADDEDAGVKDFLVAIGAVEKRDDFAFYRDNVALSQDPNSDHDYAPLCQVPIPAEGWKLAFDPKNRGHKETTPWFAPAFDDAAWKTAHVKAHWESQGFPDYDGVAWYRVRFAAPEKPAEGKSFELCFGGVDEDAWVWLNGTYVGQHTEGEAGWNKPFRFNVERELKWGQENVLAVRVFDSRFGGGIWKPVTLEVLK